MRWHGPVQRVLLDEPLCFDAYPWIAVLATQVTLTMPGGYSSASFT